MAFQIFKKRKDEIRGASRKTGNVSPQKKENAASAKDAAPSIPLKTARERTADLLKSPHVTEKATLLSDVFHQYVFKVFPRSNKTEIKKAVEDAYGIHVTKVNIVKLPGKTIRVGRRVGKTKGHIKAIISLKKGEKIEIVSR